METLARKLASWWAVRSLLVGGVSTIVDLSIGTSLIFLAHVSTRPATMFALGVGSTLNFFLNRYLAFRESHAKVLEPALRWLLMVSIGLIVHGQITVTLRDHLGVPFVPAKMTADLILTAVNLLVMRHYVFRPPPIAQPQP